MNFVIEETSGIEFGKLVTEGDGDIEPGADLRGEHGEETLPLSAALRPAFHTFSSPRGHFSFPSSSTSAK